MSAIRTVLVANRGEIALRVIRTCRELGIRTVAVYSDADASTRHVRAADQAIRIGPAPSTQSYLNMEAIINAAKTAGADAIHPGYGFLSENSTFASLVREAGFLFVGPPPEAIKAMGDKTAARQLMIKAGVPVVPGTDGPVSCEDDAARFCAAHGFPALLKAAAGGGGKGMRLVHAMEELPGAFRAASSEAKAAFGDARVYLEKYLEHPRHIEVQILADAHGNVVHLGERECSIQRRHQKVIEESPSVALTPEVRSRICATAVQAAQAAGYVNAGTIEFLFDATGSFYFLEMNTRLQVEHPVTELRTGLDLVALQLRVAEGEPLPFRQEDIAWRGHAIECRICAEDVENNYAPSTGRILHLRTPQGPGVREDSAVEQGSEVSVYYDPMIAKLCVWAPTRLEAIRRMHRALEEYEILGITTNVPLLRFVMDDTTFRAGDFSTHFLAERFSPALLQRDGEAVARAAAIVCALLEERREGSAATVAASGHNGHAAASRWKQRRFDH